MEVIETHKGLVTMNQDFSATMNYYYCVKGSLSALLHQKTPTSPCIRHWRKRDPNS